jgi:hypothetical protein
MVQRRKISKRSTIQQMTHTSTAQSAAVCLTTVLLFTGGNQNGWAQRHQVHSHTYTPAKCRSISEYYILAVCVVLVCAWQQPHLRHVHLLLPPHGTGRTRNAGRSKGSAATYSTAYNRI